MLNSEDIPWKRIAAEGIAIVVSILIAFWIDAWWQARVERVALVEYLAHFDNELVANDELIDAHLNDITDDLISLHKVLTAIADSNDEALGELLMRDLGRALYIRSPTVNSSALEALSASGYVRLVSNAELIRMINEYESSAQLLYVVRDLTNSSYLDYVMPVLGDYAVLSELGWQEYDNHVSASGENTGVTPDAPFTNDSTGLKSQRVWNALFHWKTIKIDTSHTLKRLKEQGVRLRHQLRLEIESQEH